MKTPLLVANDSRDSNRNPRWIGIITEVPARLNCHCPGFWVNAGEPQSVIFSGYDSTARWVSGIGPDEYTLTWRRSVVGEGQSRSPSHEELDLLLQEHVGSPGVGVPLLRVGDIGGSE